MKCSQGGFRCGGVLGRHRRCSGPLGQGDGVGGRALGKSTSTSQSIILASGSGEAQQSRMVLGEDLGVSEQVAASPSPPAPGSRSAPAASATS